MRLLEVKGEEVRFSPDVPVSISRDKCVLETKVLPYNYRSLPGTS